MLKSIGELNLGYSDAENYLARERKKMFSDIFVKNSYLEKLLEPTTYFLIGEKGTGKTAYATYLANSEYKGYKSFLKFIPNTDYVDFYKLKKKNHFEVSGYVDIWKAILLLVLAKSIVEDGKITRFGPFDKGNLSSLKDAIDEYSRNAFTPEILSASKIIDNSDAAAKIVSKYMEIGSSIGTTIESTEQRFQINLRYIVEKFSESFKKLKLHKNIILFIDGIDVRPMDIPYEDYLACIRGLSSACWILNTEIFSNVRDSEGKIRVVLLLRPDIFNALNMQNSTNKLSDNAVLLDWRTTYKSYKSSSLYKMATKLLAYDQAGEQVDDIWESYFDWKRPSSNPNRDYDNAFMMFLKISLSRPRDIQRILKIQKELMEKREIANRRTFSEEVFEDDDFQNIYSEYFLGSLRDQLIFYFSEKEFSLITDFIEAIPGRSFSFYEFRTAFIKYGEKLCETENEIPQFMVDSKECLQFLYDSNIIFAIVNPREPDEEFYLSYREKKHTNIAPKVPIGENVEYRFHYGLYKQTKKGRF